MSGVAKKRVGDFSNTKYKQTEVGLIPTNWEVRRFDEVAKIERGKFTAWPRNDPKYYGGNIPFIQTGDVANSQGWIRTFSQMLNEAGLKVSKKFPAGTLFFTIAANIGDVAFSTFETACPDSLVAITPHTGVQKSWLVHELRRRKQLFENLASHNAQSNINVAKLNPVLLPLPPRAEQKAIASALGDADELIESLEKLLAKKRQIKQGAMQGLLSGRRRLPGFEGEWKQTVLRDCLVAAPSYGINAAAVEPRGRLPAYLRITDITDDGRLSEDERVAVDHELSLNYKLIENDLVFARTGASVGKSYLHRPENGELVFAGFLIRVQPDTHKLNPIFVFNFTKTEVYWNWVTAMSMRSDQPGINGAEYASMPLPLPPTLAEQAAIALVLEEMDHDNAAVQKRLAKARQLKQAMMQQLLKVKTRLV